jgi:hypothetical protein
MLLRRLVNPTPPSVLLVLGLVPKLLLLSRADDPAETRLLLLLVTEAEVVSSSTGSGQEAVGTCFILQILAVSGTLLTGRTSLARKALIRVDLPTVKHCHADAAAAQAKQ